MSGTLDQEYWRSPAVRLKNLNRIAKRGGNRKQNANAVPGKRERIIARKRAMGIGRQEASLIALAERRHAKPNIAERLYALWGAFAGATR